MKKFYSLEEIRERYNVEGDIRTKYLDKYMVKLIKDTGATSAEAIIDGDPEKGCRFVIGVELTFKTDLGLGKLRKQFDGLKGQIDKK